MTLYEHRDPPYGATSHLQLKANPAGLAVLSIAGNSAEEISIDSYYVLGTYFTQDVLSKGSKQDTCEKKNHSSISPQRGEIVIYFKPPSAFERFFMRYIWRD